MARTPLETAQKLIEIHRYREAETLLKRITAAHPSGTQAYFVLGDLYLRFQAYPEAAVQYNAVLSRDPGNFQALMSLGIVFREQGDLKQALRFFRMARKVNPDSSAVHRNLGMLYGLMGNSSSAVAEYDLLAKLDPEGDALLQMAELYEREKNLRDAEKLARLYLKSHSGDGEGWNTLGGILLKNHEDEQAWQASEQAVKSSPGNIAFLLTHAKIALELKSGRYAGIAGSDARRILRMDPANAEANRILIGANEILSARRFRFLISLFIAVVIVFLAVLRVTWRKREEREAEKRELIEKWGKELEGLNTLDEIIEAVFARCTDLFNLPKGMFFVMNHDELRMSCTFTNFKAVLAGSLEVKPETIPEWHDLFHARPITTTQAFRTPSFSAIFPNARRILEKHDIRLLIPFFAKNKLLALLALGGISRREFRNRISAIREKVETGYLYAEKAAIAIETSALYELSMMDEQTRVFNKRFFTQVLADEVKRVERYQQPVSLLMIDIDHFKDLNDTYGHPEGDSVLREIAATLKENIRQGMDSVFRYGGEEFTVILPATRAGKAGETAERIRSHISNYSFSGLPMGAQVTISIGVASFPDHANADWELIQAADHALYQSKKAGRNCVTVIDKKTEKVFPGAPANTSIEDKEP